MRPDGDFKGTKRKSIKFCKFHQFENECNCTEHDDRNVQSIITTYVEKFDYYRSHAYRLWLQFEGDS